MHIAIDLQPSPPAVPKAVKHSMLHLVTAFYVAFVALAAASGICLAQKLRLDAAEAAANTKNAAVQADLDLLKIESDKVTHSTEVANDFAEWLSITPPTQALTYLLSTQVEPNISLTKLSIEMLQGSPNLKVEIQMATKDQGAAGRQVLRSGKVLEDAGFEPVNTDADSPTPEGWNFAATYAVPSHGDYSKLNELAAQHHK